MSKLVKVGATLYWCFHNKPNDMSEKYQVDVGQLSPGAVEALLEIGLDVKECDRVGESNRGHFITCKSKNPIRIKDKAGNTYEDTLIGNGTTATVVLGAYEWTFGVGKKQKTGISPSAASIVIKELVEFEGGDASELADDDDAPEL